MTSYSPSVTTMFLIIGIGCLILAIIPLIIYSVDKIKKTKQRIRKFVKGE